MCGRYTVQVDMVEIHRRFKVAFDDLYQKNYNCAPSENLPVITNKRPEKLGYFHWGLVPFWAKDPKIGYKMINARAESLMEKASFRNALEKRRCLVVADGFYEWKKTDRGKQPYRLTVKDGPLFAFAGIWEHHKEFRISSFSIITTEANELVEPIHDRMPVILLPEHEKKWLDESLDPVEALDMLRPYPSEMMDAYPVSQEVGNVKNKFPELIIPLEK
jgi:putative SOS response-associated peptidase YedK